MDAVTEESGRVMVAEQGPTLFERAYLDCRLPVYRYLRPIAGSDDAAAELTAVAFERAFAAFGRLEAGRPVLPWLLRIARNAAIDGARRSRPLARLEEIAPYAQPAAATTPEEEALLTERDAKLLVQSAQPLDCAVIVDGLLVPAPSKLGDHPLCLA